MRVRELVEPPGPNLSLLAGAAGLDRDFEAVTITDLPDPARYLRGGELVLSGLMWLADQRGPAQSGPSAQRGSSAARCDTFVGAVARSGCPGLAVGDTTDDPLPEELVAACARLGVTLLRIPGPMPFAELTDWIAQRVSADRALRQAGHDLVALAAAAGPAAVRETLYRVRLAIRPPAAGAPDTHQDLLAGVPDEFRRAFGDRLLGPVRGYDAGHQSRLEETLEVFLDCSGSWSRCARKLHIHVNTLRYRIAKINELTGRDLSRLDHQVDFLLALRAR
ncbi:MAG: PucR family transcriptional regulator [Catenulispora sp.]